MNPATLTLLAKLLAPQTKKARPDLAPGVHEVDETITIHVNGDLKVSEDYETRLTRKVDFAALMCVAMSKLNAVSIATVLREAQTLDPDELEMFKDAAKVAMEELTEPTRSTCRGAVRVTTGSHFREITAPNGSGERE